VVEYPNLTIWKLGYTEVFAIDFLYYLYYACVNKCILVILLDTVQKKSYGWFIKMADQ
jgi:hypothetical protein